MRLLLLWLLTACTVAILGAVPADGARKGRCDRHARGAELRTGQALVFRRWIDEDISSRLYACVRPSGTARLLARVEEDDDLYGSDAFFASLRLGGRYAAGEFVTGAASASQCSKYGGDPCPTIEHRVRILEIAGGRRLDVPTTYLVAPVLVSRDGVVVWVTGSSTDAHLVATATRAAPQPGRLVASPAELDHGVDAASVRLSGRTVTWTHGGENRSAVVAPLPAAALR